MSNKEDTNIRRGSNNVFADLGYSDPDTHLLKAQLVNRINEIIRQQNLTQTQAAQIMGLRAEYSNVSNLSCCCHCH